MLLKKNKIQHSGVRSQESGVRSQESGARMKNAPLATNRIVSQMCVGRFRTVSSRSCTMLSPKGAT